MTTPERHQEMCRMFTAACKLSPEELPRFVAEACGSDALLRQELEALLARDREHPDFLETPAVFTHMRDPNHSVATPTTWQGSIPDRIGDYRILNLLGEGGMALVFLAEQENPHRRVAVKIIKPGFVSDEAVRRFEFEAQILGRLQHPGIAQIFEADTADLGFGAQPFFAMEYISGQGICEYVRAHPLDIPQRLNLFISVCAAVQHAHHNGVIHRDLKPSNILMDSSARPKVLDFGIARVTDSDKQATVLGTSFRQLIGTLPYMSPEQLTGDSHQIDVRSDVYALGVILYELLAGQLPLDLSSLSIPDAVVQIRELDPPPLSAVAKSFRGELETIVAKALEKDKTRRYQSASDLADDLQRYLRGDPIEAKRHSTLYVLGKNLRRYRWAVIVSVAFVVGLGAFAAYAGVQAGRFSRLARQERVAREEAVAQRKAALLEAERARAISSFLENTLSLANPDIVQSPDLTVRDVLDRTSEQISLALADQPETEAALRIVVGSAYFSLGELELADLHLIRALKIREAVVHSTPAEQYEAIHAFANVHSYIGDNFAISSLRIQFRLGTQIIGATRPELVRLLAEAPWREMGVDPDGGVRHLCGKIMRLAQSSLQPDDPLWIYLSDQLFSIGTRLQYWEPRDLAIPFLSNAIEIRRRLAPQSYTEIVTQLGRLSECLVAAGRHQDAETAARESLDLIARILPEDHWYAALGKARLGASLAGQGRYEQAERILLDSNTRMIEMLGIESGRNSVPLISLVRLYEAWEKPEAAAAYRDRLALSLARSEWDSPLPAMKHAFDTRHTELLDALETLYFTLTGSGEELGPTLRAVLNLRDQLVPDDDPRAAVIARYLLSLWYEGQKTKEYQIGTDQLQLALYADVVERLRASPHACPTTLARALIYHSLSLQKRGEFELAEGAARECLLLRQRHNARPRYVATAKSILGACLTGQARYAEAEPLLKEGFLALAGDLGLRVGDTALALERLHGLYSQWGQLERLDAVLVRLAEQALDRSGNSTELNEVAWAIARSPGFTNSSYATAVKVAEKAVAISPDNAAWLNTLGVARYRTHQYDLALATLERSNGLAGGTSYPDLAFLALTHWQLGSSQQASKMLEQLHELVANRALHDNRECMGFLREAESLMAGDSARPAAGRKNGVGIR